MTTTEQMNSPFYSKALDKGNYKLHMHHPMTVNVILLPTWGRHSAWFVEFEKNGKTFRTKQRFDKKGDALDYAKGALAALIEQEQIDLAMAKEKINASEHTERPNEIPFRQASQRMSKKDALEVLGLHEGANLQEVKTKHRALTMQIHPDKGGSTFLMVQINLAKDVLEQYLR